MTHNDALAAYLGPELFDRLAWEALSEAQRAAILSVFRVGICAGAASGAIAVIDEVLADGRVVICEDGSHWAACEEDDAHLFEDWGEGAMIAIHRGLAYRLDPYQAAEVEPLVL
jgi:hypothetical protein